MKSLKLLFLSILSLGLIGQYTCKAADYAAYLRYAQQGIKNYAPMAMLATGFGAEVTGRQAPQKKGALVSAGILLSHICLRTLPKAWQLGGVAGAKRFLCDLFYLKFAEIAGAVAGTVTKNILRGNHPFLYEWTASKHPYMYELIKNSSKSIVQKNGSKLAVAKKGDKKKQAPKINKPKVVSRSQAKNKKK